MSVEPLPPERLCERCDRDRFQFETTAELAPLAGRFDQERALEAIDFGMSVRHDGYNVFAMGPVEAGKHTTVRLMLEERARSERVPEDVCYLNNFQTPHRPRVLRLPAGKGRALRADLTALVDELQTAIPAAFESDEYRTRKQALEAEIKERHEQGLNAIRQKAEEMGVALLQTPAGFAFAPTLKGEILTPEVFARLSEEDRDRHEKNIGRLEEELRTFIEGLPKLEREVRHRVRQLRHEVVDAVVGHYFADAKKKYEEHPAVVSHLDDMARDVVESAKEFVKPPEGLPALAVGIYDTGQLRDNPLLRRYGANLLVDHAETRGAPVVYEDQPTFEALVGRIEHLPVMGALVTDFQLIKAGALHRANGGYLVLDARNLLLSPYAWEGLKRALRAGQIRIEPLGRALGIMSTVSLEPEAVPLVVKVVLLGERMLYYLLAAHEPEFHPLFKVVADFEDEMPRNAERDLLYARVVGTVARDEKLLPFDRGGVARVIEEAARRAGDAERLSVHMGTLLDLLREADHFARSAGVAAVRERDVDDAVRANERRHGRIRERLLEEITRGTILVDTAGARIGQVNGLSVLMLGRTSFGRPSRITCKVRLGKGEVVDIEREVQLGGPIHSKGVLILSALLGARYVADLPLSLSATLVFEQSYGMIEGDSASCAELYALLSALAEVPIRQSIAVTGSVNQHGEVQAIGGVNEKIEGFFEVCRARGLTGEQGVMIPESNVKHLMLRRDVVDAVREGKFQIWAVRSIDAGLEVLTGMRAGERGADGRYAEATVHHLVEERLTRLAKQRIALASMGEKDKEKPA